MACTVGRSVCTLLLLLVTQCMGQGLTPIDTKARLGASEAVKSLNGIYQHSKAWRDRYRNAATACSRNQGSLCAAGLDTDEKAQLLMATSPQKFDARSSSDMGGFSAVGAVKDQGKCNTCVSFTVLAAAQSAMACALKRDATSDLSEQDFFFCKTVETGEERTCTSSWNMKNGVVALVSITDAAKYPVLETCLPYNPSQTDCNADCQDTEADLKKGKFKYVGMEENVWQVQQHIRTWGSVVTRLDVYDDFRAFFDKTPGGIYPGPGPSAKLEVSHAIQLVGYNLDSTPQYWIAKNSWGIGFAVGGFFKVAMGVDKTGVCSPTDTFGLKFILNTPLPKPYNRLSPTAGRPGCFDYRATPSDYISKVADLYGLSAQQILLDNKDVVPSPDMYLTGITLVLCGLRVPGGGGAAIPPPAEPAAPPPAQPASPAPKQSSGQQQQQKPQQKQADTSGGESSGGDQPYTGPLYYLVIGTYKGSVNCDDKQGTATAVLQKDDMRNVGQVRMQSTVVLSQCTYKMSLACNSVRDGTGTWCTGNDEPWSCVVEQTPQWDACGGQAPQKASTLQMCFSSNSLVLKSLSPTCSSGSGTLNLQ